MTTHYIEDQPGGVSLVLADDSTPAFYPAHSTAAAWVRLWARDSGKGVDSAFILAEGKPGGEFSIPYAALQNRDLLVASITHSSNGTPSVSDLNHAEWLPLSVLVGTANAAGFDAHVPTVTAAPTVAKPVPTVNEWEVFTPAPDAYGSTVTDGQIRVKKSSDNSLVATYPVGVNPSSRVPQTTFDAKIDYRWRNQSEEDAGAGRGWSNWSAAATANGSDNATQPPSSTSVASSFNYDPHDSRSGSSVGVIGA